MTDNKKTKILALGDCMAFNTGVGLQTRYIMQGLAAKGNYEVLQLGGAKKHPSMNTFRYSDEIVIKPVQGYGDKMTLRVAMDEYKPDIVWFMTDPRFYGWLFEMSDEILGRCPLVYWHVWDNPPAPKFNMPFYESCSHVGCISKLTYKMLHDELGLKNCSYVPHTLPRDIFKPEKSKKRELREKYFHDRNLGDKFVMLWIGVNARRKRIGDMVLAFDQILQIHPEAVLIMKTRARSEEALNPFIAIQDLCENIKINENFFLIENFDDTHEGKKVLRDLTEQEMADLYTLSDVLINNSSHEGFGLSIMQSLYTATPPVVHTTGGMTGQLTDKDGNFVCGFPVPPSATTIMGDPSVPYITEDFLDPKDIATAINTIIDNNKSDKKWLEKEGDKCWEHSKNFHLQNMIDSWEEIIKNALKEHPNRQKFTVSTL